MAVVAQDSSRHFPEGACNVTIPKVKGVRNQLLQNITPIVERSIRKGLYPGAVVLAAHNGHVIYRGVFGNRRILPNKAPMTFDTIFDLASLTKAVITTTAIMQLVERGKLDLDSPISHYWPKFAANGKGNITVRELLTHTSGLPADITLLKADQSQSEDNEINLGKKRVLNAAEHTQLINPPGKVFTYSDVNFIALGHLVEIISDENLDDYARNHIIKPLGLTRTFFLPPPDLKDKIAPTEVIKGKLRWGEVHDDNVRIMGGVSGMAGLFSTAKDLGIFAQCLLNGGRIPSSDGQKSSRHLLGPLSIIKMSSPQTPKFMTDIHGLGWDIDTRYSNRGVLFPTHSFGHTGWTGTSIWIDPTTQTWFVILTSRAHPSVPPVNQLIYDRKIIANIIASSITDIPIVKIKNTGDGELARAYKY